MHSHSFTCHKPPNGLHNCRLAKPSGISASTCPVQLSSTEDENGEINYLVLPSVDFAINPNLRNHKEQPYPALDDRIIG